MAASRAPELSVITVTHGRRDLVLEKAQTLVRQTLRPDAFEWLVLCNDDPAAYRALSDLDLAFTVRLEQSSTQLPASEARNRLAELASGSILLMSDDDCLPTSGSLRAHLDAHSDSPDIAAIGPLRLPDGLRRDQFREPFERIPSCLGRAFWINATGANTSFRAERFRAVGGYDEAFVGYGGEDPDLALRLRRIGVRFRFVPAATALHVGRQLGVDGSEKAMSAGRAHVHVAHRHQDWDVPWLLGVHPWMLAMKRALLSSFVGRIFDEDVKEYELAYVRGATAAWKEIGP